MKQYTYLLINFLTIIVCFIFSFHPKIKFNKFFSPFIKSSLLVAAPFILWDIYFTDISVWWFNPDYTLGLSIINLPLEECLFFICIPFACVFSYYCLNKFFNLQWAEAFNNIIVFLSCVAFIVIALLHQDKIYTSSTALATTAVLLYLHFIAKSGFIGRATLVYIALFPGFFLVNGMLTGTGLEAPIVNYNPAEFLNLRIGTIPIEDFFYGYSLFLLNIYFFIRFTNRVNLFESQVKK